MKTFDKEILIDLSHRQSPEGFRYVATEDNGDSRWSNHYSVIFEHDGQLWASDYSVGKSETQDQSAYEYDEPTAYLVKKVERVVTITDYVRMNDDEAQAVQERTQKADS